MSQNRKGLHSEYKAENRLFLNEGHSHETTELKLLFLSEGFRMSGCGKITA